MHLLARDRELAAEARLKDANHDIMLPDEPKVLLGILGFFNSMDKNWTSAKFDFTR
jgi:hypothetical protein